MSVEIRAAQEADAAVIHTFIRELADYEKLLHKVEATEADTRAALFGDKPRVFADIAEVNGEPVGLALWFYTYSTFTGRHGIYLEDLFVRPAARGKGAGKALLSGLAQRAEREGLKRLDWAVLDWNEPSIAFYDSLGADSLNEWITRRVHGEALAKLAAATPREQ